MQVPAGAGGDREGHAVEVLGHGQHDDPRPRVGGEQPAHGLDAAEAGHPYVHQNQVRTIGTPAAEHFFAVSRRRHALYAGHGRDRAAKRLSGEWGVVANEDGSHGRPPELMRVTLSLQGWYVSSPSAVDRSSGAPGTNAVNRFRTLNDGHPKELRGLPAPVATTVATGTGATHVATLGDEPVTE
ncbi:hypothetical protein GCM10009802_35710 [Streptomyces synnematoformans]|uniref:Uncharacterized protein n=1 Tax=Streptomyces synnematoformans TaxID=415721 RepID=A0ABN2YK11_9ACTN